MTKAKGTGNAFANNIKKNNPDGAVGIVSNTENEKVIEKDKINVIDKTDNVPGDKKSGFDDVPEERKVKKNNMSIVLEENSKNILAKIVKQKNKKANALVNKFLEDSYNRNTESFSIEVIALKEEVSKATTFLVAKDISMALKKEAAKRNMSASAYFCRMLEIYAGEDKQ